MHYHVYNDGKEKGPFSEAHIKSMNSMGLFTGPAFYRKENSDKWEPLSSLCIRREMDKSIDNQPSQQAAKPDDEQQSPEALVSSQAEDRSWNNRYVVTKTKIGHIFIVAGASYPNQNNKYIRSTIDSQVCEVNLTWGKYPTISYIKGILWKASNRLIFERDSIQIGYLNDEAARVEYKNFKSQSASRRGAAGGLIFSAISYFASGATANTEHIKGFYLYCKNDKENSENFAAVGDADVIDQIVQSASDH